MSNNELPIELDVSEVKSLRDQGESFVLLDIRERDEYDVAKIDGSVLIPMSELRDRLDELEPHREERIVVHCHHGGRSMQVTNALRARDFAKCQNMAGGIDQWSLQIDSSIPRY
jgi:rhodanese-related sulfurtransferase